VAYNPRGYWEHRELTEISDAILSRHDGSWDVPPLLPPGWSQSSRLIDLSRRAQQLIRDQFGGLPLWGWKDPRCCLTLPFWQHLLPNIRYVICLRNPVDVARSLEHREGFSPEKSSALWLKYASSALGFTEGKPRLIVFYEDLMGDCLRELWRLGDFLGRTEQANQAKVQEAVQQFLEGGLHHFHASVGDTTTNLRIDRRATALYFALKLSVDLGRTRTDDQVGTEDAIDQALEAMQGLARTSAYGIWPAENASVLETVSSQLYEHNRALQSQEEYAEERIRVLSAQLIRAETQLQNIKAARSYRLMSRYGLIKQRYLMSIYRLFGFAEPK